MKSKKTIMIADDHQLFLDGMIRILDDETDFTIIGAYNSSSKLFHALNNQQPDLIILDIQMPNKNGFDLCIQIKSRFPIIKILFISMLESADMIRNIKKIGANGFMSKTTDAFVVKKTIREILNGKDVFLPIERKTSVEENLTVNIFSLSKREIEIISLIKKGLSSKQIADLLTISNYTVETHRKNIFRKLKVKSVSELVAFAYDNNIISFLLFFTYFV